MLLFGVKQIAPQKAQQGVGSDTCTSSTFDLVCDMT